MWVWLLFFAAALLSPAYGAGAGAARLVCYVENARVTNGFSECTHLVYAGDARGAKLDTLLKDYKKNNPNLKIILRINEVDKDLRSLLKTKHVQGLEIYNAHKSLNKTMVSETVEAARTAISTSGGGPIFLALPAHPELLAKYYDLRTLIKKVDLMMVETHNLGLVKKMTYHPSRLSGMWDMMNTDSVVDLVIGLGVPASKVVISLPATARQFTLANETLSTPGSPTVDDEPKEIDQAELCRQLRNGRWTLERDQDLSAPYAFKNKTWISFEDSSSVDVKGKYARVRGLAGLALHRAERDVETGCGPTLRAALTKVLNQQSRAPRAAVLRSLEHEILSAPGHVRALNALQVSPYRITQIVDADGVIHSIREDTRTEFSCSRQGYFVHPRSCARFYRCVKFDQLSPEYTVFEFDCPAGLAFDSRYEVCVWPGSLPHSQACPGSSEIAPVPKTRFICPEHEGYYADPENCRWFFACLDHGTSPLTAYEFRCPFGLGFDADRLKCDWPWLVPNCGNIGRYEAEAYGFSAAILTGAAGFHGQTADAVNVAAHQSLVSGASLDNLVGIQGSFLTTGDALDSNFITSQELSNAGQSFTIDQSSTGGLSHQVGVESSGFVQPSQYSNNAQYTSGSIILDDYRLPTKEELAHKGAINIQAETLTSNGQVTQFAQSSGNANGYNRYHAGQAGQAGGYNGFSGSTYSGQKQYLAQYQDANYNDDNSGAYVHDPSGDYAEPYKHIDSPTVPYIHDDAAYKHSSEYYDYGKYAGSSQGSSGVQYGQDHSGQYTPDNSGAYVDSNAGSSGYYTSGYNTNDSGAYKYDNSGKYIAGVYRADGHIGKGKITSSSNSQVYHEYSEANAGNYINNDKAYSGLPHTLKAGAINVGLVGKTTLIDADYNDQNNYFGSNTYHTQSYNQAVHPAHIVSHVSHPVVSINHAGTDGNNLDGYNYVTTPTSSGIPTTATPFAVTTSLPVVTTYKTYVPKAPKTSVKQIFGISQPAITYVQPTVIAIKESTPQVHVTNHNEGINYQYENKNYYSDSYNSGKTNEESGYVYAKPSVKFEDGISYSTAAPAISVSTYKPAEFSHNQQTYHDVESVEYSTRIPVQEEPFKKVVAYTTGPSVVSYVQPTIASYTPQSFSHQTIHKIESNNNYVPSVVADYEQSKTQVTYEEPKVVQYTTPQPSLAVQPAISTYHPQVVSHETVHKVDTELVNTYSGESGYNYEKPSIQFDEVKTIYSTPTPIASSTYKPQTYLSHQTIHRAKPQKFVAISTTPKYDVSYQSTPVTVYENPLITHTQKITPVTYVKPAYHSQAFSHQTIHKVENSQPHSAGNIETEYKYIKPAGFEQQYDIHYTTAQPAVTSTYEPQVYSSQTIHKVDSSQINTYSEEGNNYQKAAVKYEEVPKAIFEYSTPAPIVTSTYRPHHQFNHQTVHKVDESQVNTYSQDTTGYEYKKPAVKFVEQPKTVFEYSTAAPVVTSTYKPQSYSHQTIHQVESRKYIPVSSTVIPKIDLAYQKAVSTYQNPLLEYTQKATPISYVQPTAAVYTQTYKPIIQQHEVKHIVSQPVQYQQNVLLNQEGYSYSQPEIQRNVETNKGYSDASSVSHQYYHQSNVKHNYDSGKFIVSTSPSTLIYEDHYTEYESPKKEYKGSEYIPPRNQYKSYSTVSTTSSPIVQQSSVIHQAQEYVAPKIDIVSTVTPVVHQNFNIGQTQEQIQDSFYDKSDDYSQQYEIRQQTVPSVQHISFSTSHEDRSQKVKPIHLSSPSTTVNTHYQQAAYQVPEFEVRQSQDNNQDNYGYKEEVYSQQYETAHKIPSTQHISFSTSHVVQPQIVESIHFSYPSTTAKSHYQHAEYQTPEIQVAYKAENYLPPVVTTAVPLVASTYRPKTYSTISTNREYLPPSTTTRPLLKSAKPSYRYKSTTENSGAGVVSYESFGYNNADSSVQYNPQALITVTHDSTPIHKHNIVVETAKSHLLGFGTVGPDAGLVLETYTTAAPIVSSTYRQRVKSTTPAYKSTTEYQAPEYLPPSGLDRAEIDLDGYGLKNEESFSKIQYNPYNQATVVSTAAPISRKQNIVVETAKTHLLGYETAGPDAGLVSPVSYTTSTPVVLSNTEAYSLSQKSSTYAPVEQGLFEVTPSSVPIRRVKPKVAVVTKINDFNPFLVRKLGAVCSCQSPVLVLKGRRPTHVVPNVNDYDSSRGDIDGEENAGRYIKSQNILETVATPAPIVASTFNPIIVPDDSYYQDLQEYDVAVTPKQVESYISSTPKPARIRSRVKSVTVAPTYQTVLLNQEATPTIAIKGDSASVIESQAFDRYGPGGWRSRDETLQGTVDCKRAGLFRHPKQCNKFYACRWDCTKERFTLHVFNCPVQLSFDPSIGACNWPSQGPACQGDTLLTNVI